MMFSNTKRDNIFFTVIFILFYILTVCAVPHLGIRMGFLSFGGLINQSTVRPDIIFALVLCTAIFSSRRRAVVLGIIFGFIVDITCFAPVFSPLVYCICGLYAYSASQTFAGHGVVNAMIVSLPLLLTKVIVGMFYLLATWHDISFSDILFGAVLPEYLYNILTVGVVYLVLKLLMKLFKVERMI